MIEQLKQLLNLKMQRLLRKSSGAVRQFNFPYGNFGQQPINLPVTPTIPQAGGSTGNNTTPSNIPFNRFPY